MPRQMAGTTQGHTILNRKPKLRRILPMLEVMRLKSFWALDATIHTAHLVTAQHTRPPLPVGIPIVISPSFRNATKSRVELSALLMSSIPPCA
jgi:hypothetical protein